MEYYLKPKLIFLNSYSEVSVDSYSEGLQHDCWNVNSNKLLKVIPRVV